MPLNTDWRRGYSRVPSLGVRRRDLPVKIVRRRNCSELADDLVNHCHWPSVKLHVRGVWTANRLTRGLGSAPAARLQTVLCIRVTGIYCGRPVCGFRMFRLLLESCALPLSGFSMLHLGDASCRVLVL